MRKLMSFFAALMFCSAFVSAQSDNAVLYQTTLYKISFPATPTKSVQNMPSALGQLAMTIAAYEPEAGSKDDNHVYMIMESDYPDSIIHSDKKEILDNFFRGAIDGSVKSLNSSLIKETPGSVGPYPSRTVEIDYNGGLAIIKMKLILCKNKCIIIQTITETKKYPNPAIDKFFDSFVLKAN